MHKHTGCASVKPGLHSWAMLLSHCHAAHVQLCCGRIKKTDGLLTSKDQHMASTAVFGLGHACMALRNNATACLLPSQPCWCASWDVLELAVCWTPDGSSLASPLQGAHLPVACVVWVTYMGVPAGRRACTLMRY